MATARPQRLRASAPPAQRSRARRWALAHACFVIACARDARRERPAAARARPKRRSPRARGVARAAPGAAEVADASSISTWLYTIARRFCLKKRRKRKFVPDDQRSLETDAAAETGALPDPAQAPDDALAGKRVEIALANAIESLEPIYREVLLLRDVEGLTAPETAEVLGVGVQAVKSRLHRARLALRAELAPALGMPDVAAPSTCPDVLGMFSRHLEDEISADVCAEMERHIAGCARCRRACDSLKRTLALCKSTRTPHVPAAVQKSVRVALHDFLATRR